MERPDYHPQEDSAKQLVEEVHNRMKGYVQWVKGGQRKNVVNWSTEEYNIEKAQLLMKRYQKRLKMNKAIYPELMWEDLRLTLSDHQQEWGNVSADPTPTSGSTHPNENRGSGVAEWCDPTPAC